MKIELNANNIGAALPEEVLTYLHDRYDTLKIPVEVTSIDGLGLIERQMSWIANEGTYLNYLFNVVDIETRNSKVNGPQEKHDNDVCKKNIIKSYITNLDKLNQLLSRKITMYSLVLDNDRKEMRLANMEREYS